MTNEPRHRVLGADFVMHVTDGDGDEHDIGEFVNLMLSWEHNVERFGYPLAATDDQELGLSCFQAGIETGIQAVVLELFGPEVLDKFDRACDEARELIRSTDARSDA